MHAFIHILIHPSSALKLFPFINCQYPFAPEPEVGFLNPLSATAKYLKSSGTPSRCRIFLTSGKYLANFKCNSVDDCQYALTFSSRSKLFHRYLHLTVLFLLQNQTFYPILHWPLVVKVEKFGHAAFELGDRDRKVTPINKPKYGQYDTKWFF